MQIDNEARLLTFYLTNRLPTAEVLVLYKQALQKIPMAFDPAQKRVWEFCMKRIWALPFIDAALALSDRYHPVRQRIFIMLAILETQPTYNDYFLPQNRSVTFIFPVLLRLVKATFKAVIGKILLWFI
jgi:hypothetical protein